MNDMLSYVYILLEQVHGGTDDILAELRDPSLNLVRKDPYAPFQIKTPSN